MIVRIPSQAAARIFKVLKVAEVTAFLAGFGLLGWVGFVLLDSAYTQWEGGRVLAAERRETIVSKAPKSGKRRAPVVKEGTVVGKFELPRLGLSYVVLEGTADRTLDKSIGRVVGSSLLGEPGNIGIAGHRNTHFRKLEWARRDDEIIITTRDFEYKYRVEWVRLFQPDDIQVLDPSHGPAVTLVTCFPFEYVGAAPLRYVIRALPDEQTRTKLLAEAQPAPEAP